jgi:TorA maturation chaperone TorD
MSMEVIGDIELTRNVYLFLSRIYLEEVDGELLGVMRSDGLASALAAMGVMAPNGPPGDKNVLESMAVAYSALFVQPGSYPLYESIHLHGRYLAPPADKVESQYQRAGFDYRKRYPSLFPDHAGIEFLFIASLLEGYIAAIKSGDEPLAAGYVLEKDKFLNEHIGKWFPGYAEKARDLTDNRFYRAVLEMTAGFVQSEMETAGPGVGNDGKN